MAQVTSGKIARCDWLGRHFRFICADGCQVANDNVNY